MPSNYDDAIAHHNAGRLREAIRSYRAAVLEEPERARVFTNFARALSAVDATKERAEANKQAQHAVSLAPTDAYVVGTAADLFVAEERYADAIALCERFISAAAGTPARVDLVFTPYAQSLLATDRDDDALAAAEKACAGEPHNPDAYVVYAQALGVHYRIDEARDALDHAERFAKGHDTIASVRATIEALAVEMVSSVDRVYDAALASDDCDSWCVLGGVLQRLDRSQEALGAFAEAIARDPESPDAWWGHGLALKALGDRFPEDVYSLQYAGILQDRSKRKRK
jgi:tetratricopeptide (TPR) repeat protein